MRDIEAGLERDRDEVAQAFAALRDRFSPDSLWQDAAGVMERNAGAYAQVIDRAIRANPVALAVSAVGLAWLILGRRGVPPTPASDTSSLAGTRYEAMTRWEDEGGPVADEPPTAPSSPDDWTIEADRLRDRATRLIDQINDAVRKGIAPAADLARHRTDVLEALTRDVRRALGRGLEEMAEPARAAVLSARERAYEAHLLARRKTAGALGDRPLTGAVVLAGVGATVAALLPRSAAEDRILGDMRDRIVDALARVVEDERQRVTASAVRAVEGVLSELSPPPAPARPAGEDVVPAADR